MATPAAQRRAINDTEDRLVPQPTSKLEVPVSIGEAFDKLTILEIKAQLIGDAAKLHNVNVELHALEAAVAGSFVETPEVERIRALLLATNRELWDIEDALREHERAQTFGADFIALARSVYITNDRRAALKRELNVSLGSALVEEKSYEDYGSAGER